MGSEGKHNCSLARSDDRPHARSAHRSMAKYRPEAAIERSLAQAHSFAHAVHDLIGDFVGARSAAAEDIVDVRLVLEYFFTAFAHRREILPEFFEQLFLEITVASTAFSKLLAHVCDFIVRRYQRVQLEDCRCRRVLWRIHRQRIGDDAHHAFSHFFFVAENVDVVAVTFAHLLPIDARYSFSCGLNTWLGQLENLPIYFVHLHR